MRTLKFIIEKQIIKPDPNCDFEGLVPGSAGYLQAEFTFSPEWNGSVKVAGFSSPITGKEYPPQILADGKTCIIPAEALVKRKFKIWVIGKKDNENLTTNKLEVEQNGGRS